MFFRNVSLSRGKSTTRFGWVTVFPWGGWQFSLDVKQKHTLYQRKSTKKSRRSAPLTTIILLEQKTIQQPTTNTTQTTQQQHNHTTTQPHNHTTTQHTNATTQQRNNTTTQQYNTPTQQHDNAAPQLRSYAATQLRSHATTQLRSNYAATTQQLRSNYAATTQQLRSNYAATTQQLRSNNAATTQQQRNNNHQQQQQPKARAGEEESELHHTAKVRKIPPSQPELFSLYEEEPGRAAGAAGADPAAHRGAACQNCSHGADPRRSCASDSGPAGGSAQAFRHQVPEQVVDVPKITSQDVVPQRAVLRVPQMAEQRFSGRSWCRVVGPAGVQMIGTSNAQWTPDGITARPGRYRPWWGLWWLTSL